VIFTQGPPLRLVRCGVCEHLYRNPREQADALRETYADAPMCESACHSLFTIQRAAFSAQASRLRKLCGPIESGLEVGSYVGAFLAAARDSGMRFTGIDVSASASAFAARRGLRVEIASIEELPGEGRHDAIAIWNTFEQLPDAIHGEHGDESRKAVPLQQ